MINDTELSLLSLVASANAKLSSDVRAKNVFEGASLVATTSEAPTRVVAGEIARSTFLRFQLLPDELIAIFSSPSEEDTPQTQAPTKHNVDRLAAILAHEFIHSLYLKKMASQKAGTYTPDATDSENVAMFRQELIDFLTIFHTSKTTLHNFLIIQSQLYPNVDIHLLFENPEIRELLMKQVSRVSLPEIHTAYDAMYREDPDHFIFQYLSKRVLAPLSHVAITQKALTRIAGNMDRLLDFLVKKGYQLEELYMLLYRRLSQWREAVDIHESTRHKVQRAHPDILAEPNNEQDAGMLDPRFDFDAFFNTYFRSAITKARSKEIPESPRHIDLQIKGWNFLIAPSRAMDPFKEMAKHALVQDETVFSQKLRGFFGYPGPDILSDKELHDILARQLQLAAEHQIKNTIATGLKLFPKHHPIRKDYAFCEPIIECRDPRKLIIWFAYPHHFIREFPEFSSTPHGIISFQARRILEHLVMYREAAFVSDFKDRKKKRKRVQDHLIESLSISEMDSIKQGYRILVEIDPDTQEPIARPSVPGGDKHSDGEESDAYSYDVLFPDSPEWDHTKKRRNEYFLERDGRHFKALPTEEKKFIMASIKVPQLYGAPREMQVLFYSDEKNLLTCKSLESYLLTLIRGKVPSDLVRCMIAFPPKTSQEDKNALVNMLYDYCVHVVKLEHSREQRKIEKKQKTIKSATSQAFAGDRIASFASYAVLLEKLPKDASEKLSPEDLDAMLHGRFGFEIQVLDLESLAIAASDYTVTSHHTSYAPERAFNVIAQKYFPPIIYGAKYAEHILRGFRDTRKGS